VTPGGDRAERPYQQDTIEAAGREWSKANTVKELRGLDEYLWDNYDDRIDRESHLKLRGWIREKEREHSREPDKKEPQGGKDEKRRQEIEYDGKKYKKSDSYEKLTGLSRELRGKSEKLPHDDYCKLRGWIENKDRERFSGYLDKGIQKARKDTERSKSAEELKAAEGGRVIDPIQQEVMRNPVVGLFMQGAAVANMIVGSIRLDDSGRDYTKEQRDGLEDQKKALDEREKERGFTGIFTGKFNKQQEERDREQREKVEKAIEENEKRKEKEKKKERERKQEKDRSPFERDPWGRW
jgi:hypothetical protein